MYNSPPDYYYSAWGCPTYKWQLDINNKNRQKLLLLNDLHLKNETTTLNNKQQKLLPLRETLTEQYLTTIRSYKNVISKDVAQQKQHKNKSNDFLKEQQSRISLKSETQTARGTYANKLNMEFKNKPNHAAKAKKHSKMNKLCVNNSELDSF